ncbi:hypothetical protein UCDDS831_g05937 [Diplodia seriata]|uniref:Uncharacterized protein n=1 Tax=Diplodia seriata TaxID=420778 RepID=A0A0G2GP90_9PEZI|nr:hypothetical protein UCDDS831_g05937 [Diplodia seriata]
MLNITSLPAVHGAVCHMSLRKVTVETVFARQSSSFGTTNRSFWSPVRFDATTLKNTSSVPEVPYWLSPPAADKWWHNLTDSYYTPVTGLLLSPTLWPTISSSANFFELLASYATYTLGNSTAILDPDTFVTASEAVYTSFVTNMLTQLRPWVLSASNNTAPAAVISDGTITYREPRITQDLASTIALETCLAVMLVCFVWVALRFPNEAYHQVEDVSIIYCRPYLQLLEVEITFILPDYDIDESAPPLPDEATAQFVSNTTTIIAMPRAPELGTSGVQNVDGFFYTLTTGYQATPLSERIGLNNTATLLAKTQHLYRQMVAQVIHHNRRTPSVPTTTDPSAPFAPQRSLHATVLNVAHTRLQQSAVSTRILEGFLALLAVCAIVAFWLNRPTRVLLEDPSNIAARMRLFSESSLLAMVPAEDGGGLWDVDGEGRERWFAGKTFGLGWWLREALEDIRSRKTASLG